MDYIRSFSSPVLLSRLSVTSVGTRDCFLRGLSNRHGYPRHPIETSPSRRHGTKFSTRRTKAATGADYYSRLRQKRLYKRPFNTPLASASSPVGMLRLPRALRHSDSESTVHHTRCTMSTLAGVRCNLLVLPFSWLGKLPKLLSCMEFYVPLSTTLVVVNELYVWAVRVRLCMAYFHTS